ncbi:MAG: hypothetical protein ABSA70_08500 [Terriglobia bacterium]
MMGETRILLLSVALCVLVPVVSTPQDAAKKSPDTPSTKSSTSTAKKPALAEVTRVSTDEAARSAAQKQTAKGNKEDGAKEDNEAAVLEFKPAPASAESSGDVVVVPSKKSKKSVLGNVHGTVHGSLDSKNAGTHRTGASVGASSKSGKTAVYVETERSRTQPDPPR